MFLFALCSQMSVYSDNIVIGLILGVDSVVQFSLTQRLLLLADGQILAIGGATWAALAELHLRGDTERMNDRLIVLTRVTALMACGLLLPIAAATPSFVHLWVGPVGYGGAGLVVTTVTWTCLHGLIALWAWPLMATGHVRSVLPVMIVGAVVNVAISVVATERLGVIGPALGTLANYALVAIWWLPLLLRGRFGTPIRALVAAVIGPAALAVPYGAGLFLLSNVFPADGLAIPNWGRWCVLGVVVVVAVTAYFVLAWFLVLPHEDRTELRARLFER